MCRCVKFPKERKLKKYLSDVTGAVVRGYKNQDTSEKPEKADAQVKRDLFSFLPPQTKKSILLQASGVYVGVLVLHGIYMYVCMCVYVCMLYTYVCMYCMYILYVVCMYVCMYISMYICIVCKYVSICMHT